MIVVKNDKIGAQWIRTCLLLPSCEQPSSCDGQSLFRRSEQKRQALRAFLDRQAYPAFHSSLKGSLYKNVRFTNLKQRETAGIHLLAILELKVRSARSISFPKNGANPRQITFESDTQVSKNDVKEKTPSKLLAVSKR